MVAVQFLKIFFASSCCRGKQYIFGRAFQLKTASNNTSGIASVVLQTSCSALLKADRINPYRNFLLGVGEILRLLTTDLQSWKKILAVQPVWEL